MRHFRFQTARASQREARRVIAALAWHSVRRIKSHWSHPLPRVGTSWWTILVLICLEDFSTVIVIPLTSHFFYYCCHPYNRHVNYQNRSGYDEKVDWFSCGVTVYTMICGRRPFPSKKDVLRDAELKSGVSSPSASRRRSSLSDHGATSARVREATRRLMRDIEYRCLSSPCASQSLRRPLTSMFVRCSGV